ncbi:unnamed protein product [Caenorhabditis auriculariae]|uniref:SGNH hydrolase-type esterase domain-containing protein n=1 Tax=Caenorhabditis auriculariae TaxID=2777116 RepID=A0A8S1HUF5_9PELO|nr:unnamed protein product [Caenorhabditis auriculariae]
MLLYRIGDFLGLFLLLVLQIAEARIVHKPREFRCGRMVVFGDSLSDDGVEAEGESHGFLRNSNGKVWPEYAHEMLGCDQYLNYAYSGAKSGIGNFYFDTFSGIQWQTNQFLLSHKYLVDDPLIIIQTGGVIDFFAGANDSTTVVENIQNTIHNITQVIGGFLELSSRTKPTNHSSLTKLNLQTMTSGTLIVLTLMDLSSSPGIRAAEDSSQLQHRLGTLVAETNRQLHYIVLDSDIGTRRLNPFLRVKLVDVNPIVLAAMQSLNTTEPFSHHLPDLLPQSIYRYAFHDLWNPSTFVHWHLAKEIVRTLQQF